MAFRLDGKVAIVTASAQGIGAASARVMAQQGATVMLADINEALVTDTAASIVAAGGKATAMAFDARSESSVRAVIERTHKIHGRLDILHNNAGGADVPRDLKAADIPQEVWDEGFAWNFGSVQWGCRYAIPLMLETGGGAIVNTASAAAAFAQSIQTVYGVAKTAVAGFTRYVAVQYGRQNIRCNAIAPGLILSPNAEANMPAPVRATLTKHATTPRAGKPEDVGYLAAFLASEEAAYINGQTILLDGGVGIRFPHDADMVEMMAGS